MPQTVPSQGKEEAVEGRKDGCKDLGFKWQSTCQCIGSPCCSTAAESAALAQLTLSSASYPGERMGPSPNLVGPAQTTLREGARMSGAVKEPS